MKMLKLFLIFLCFKSFNSEESCGCSSNLNRNLEINIEKEKEIEEIEENKVCLNKLNEIKENMIFVEGGLFLMGSNKPIIIPVS